jgi:hypothetical protein
MDRLLLVGLEPPEIADLRPRLNVPFVSSVVLPRIKVDRGVLKVERPNAIGHFLPVTRVVFHGIFEDDFDFLTALALWGGPCLPDAAGMMDLRLRLPGLVRALRVSRFNTMPRSFAGPGVPFDAAGETVAKWGNWHCGENKERFAGRWEATEATVFEDFVTGDAVRVVLVGQQAWQIRLAGEGWKKSIHPDDAAYMPLDPDLLDDARRLQAHFRLDVVGIDYMVGADGTQHLLEVNHIPNVTRFAEVRAGYLELVAAWVETPDAGTLDSAV